VKEYKRLLITLFISLILVLAAFSPVFQGTQRFKEVITQTLNVTTSATIQDATLDDAILTDATITNVTLAGTVASSSPLSASSGLTVTGIISQAIGTQNVGISSVVTKAITYTAAAGGSGVVVTIPDGQIWMVRKVLAKVTANFDATGDDANLVVGDGNDADGFLVLADATLQAADTEGTGFAAGWQGQAAATIGAYLDANENGFIYAPSGADETIDWAVTETSGTTLTAGSATIYVFYTRIQ
jgi:hypothetical protein